MKQLDRIYQLHHLLSTHRYPLRSAILCERMECSTATLKRAIGYLRDIWGAPIICNRGVGYCYDPHIRFELPGLWFSADELRALLTMQQLIEHLQPGLLRERLKPVQKRMDAMLAEAGGVGQIKRIRILTMLPRSRSLPHFTTVATAVLSRKQFAFTYSGRGTGDDSCRTVSPQRLTHYRDNWYMDGWCHARQALRTFALERMHDIQPLEAAAKDVDEAELNRQLGSAYGIFAGVADKLAILRFTSERSRWIADETWHPEQQSAWLPDGRYELRIPYADATELILDICRYGPDVEVVEPASLRTAVIARLQQAVQQYIDSGSSFEPLPMQSAALNNAEATGDEHA